MTKEKNHHKSFWEKFQETIDELKSIKEREKEKKEGLELVAQTFQEREKIKEVIFAILHLKDGERAIELLNYFLENPRAFLPHSYLRELFPNLGIAPLHLLRFGFLEKKKIPTEEEEGYSLSMETFKKAEFIRQILKEYRILELIKITTPEGKEELKSIFEKETHFQLRLEEILKNKLEEVVNFGKNFSFSQLVGYFKKIFGENLYQIYLLAFLQQIGITGTEIVDRYGNYYLTTHFNLLFWEGQKTNHLDFLHDFLGGGEVFPPHGLKFFIKKWEDGKIPNFLKRAQAYHQKKFIFILPPLENWIQEKEFLNSLFYRRLLKAVVGKEKIGPFSLEKCCLLGKLNTANLSQEEMGTWFSFFEETSYLDLTFLFSKNISEFQRIEREIANFPPKFELQKQLEDFLVILSAIQFDHPLVRNRFPKKKILVSENFSQELEEFTEKIIYENNLAPLPVFENLKKYCLLFSATASLFEYFKQDLFLNDVPIVEITPEIKEEIFRWYENQIKVRYEIFK